MTPAEQYNQALGPVLELCKQRGFKTELIRQLSGLGMPVSKSTLSRWLTDDLARRVQPSFGAGLMLLQAATLAAREMARKEGVKVAEGVGNVAPEPS
jgi:arginine repressor